MTLQEKMKSLKSRRANLLGRAKAETKKLETEFRENSAADKRPLTEQLKSWSGKYYAIVWPILKQAKELQNAIELLR